MAVVGHGHGFGEALGLVVDPADPHRVHVAEVALRLRALLGITVALRGAGQQKARALRLRQPQGLVGTERADLEDLDGKSLEIGGACRRCEMEDRVEVSGHVEVVGDVVVLEGEPRVTEQRLDVLHSPGEKVVERDDLATLRQQAPAEMRSDEPRAARDQHALEFLPLGHRRFLPRAPANPLQRESGERIQVGS
jgi:hypothetical protein